MLVNWHYKPYLDVRARSYRFRILNGSVSRYFAIALVQQVKGTAGEIPGPPGSGVSYNRVPFHMIANDGNIMEHAVPFDGSMDLDDDGNPDTRASSRPRRIAERYDIIVDFGKNGIKPGDKLYFVNMLEHTNGKAPRRADPAGRRSCPSSTSRDGDNADGMPTAGSAATRASESSWNCGSRPTPVRT